MKRSILLLLSIATMTLLISCQPKEQASPSSDSLPPATMQVPAPGHEDVVEMRVSDDVEEAVVNLGGVVPGEVVDEQANNPAQDPRGSVADPEVPVEVKTPQQNVLLSARQWEFEPSTVTVKKGTIVNLDVVSEDVAHGIAIPAFGVNLKFGAGEAASVTFTADKSGTFPFLCNVFCGSGHGGMRGQLIVEE